MNRFCRCVIQILTRLFFLGQTTLRKKAANMGDQHMSDQRSQDAALAAAMTNTARITPGTLSFDARVLDEHTATLGGDKSPGPRRSNMHKRLARVLAMRSQTSVICLMLSR